MTFTYDVSTDLGRVRMLIGDKDSDHPIFQDDEVTAYLDMNDSNPKWAGAEALETIATDEALVQKVIKTLDLETNGATLMNSLMARAKVLREAGDKAEANGDEPLFDWAEIGETAFQKRERMWKQAERGLL